MDDSELIELFTEPADQEVVNLLKASRPAAPPLDPHFRNYLRAKLMAEAQRTLPSRAPRSWFGLGRGGLVPAMAAVAAGFLVVLGVEIYFQNQPTTTPQVAVDIHDINNKKNVAAAEPIRIPFSGPVNKNAVEETVQIQPATSFTRTWDGTTLVIVPDHKLAPNTTYTVTLKPVARPEPSAKPAAQPTPVPAPVVVRFRTAPAPIPPVVQPTYKSGSVTYGIDQRLQTSGAISSAAWTPDGQLLVTRPAAPAGATVVPGASGTPAAANAAAAKAASDVWLMSPGGAFELQLAPGGSLPAAAPAGGLFADWQPTTDGARLEVRDLMGHLQFDNLATVHAAPDHAPVWLGANRLAYLDQGVLHIVDLRGTAIPIASELKVGRGASLAASPDGVLLAAESSNAGSLVLDFNAPRTQLPPGATGFAWSSKGSLAFVVPHASTTDLYVAADGKSFQLVASSAAGQLWSDVTWAPDGASLLFATRPAGGSPQDSRLMLANANGSSPVRFTTAQREYSAPVWSPHGDLVLFSRQDEAGGRAFWTASASLGSAIDATEKAALAVVDSFMQARINGDADGAAAQLSDAARSAAQGAGVMLLSPAGTRFNRYYPVSVQLTGTDRFLVGTRLFITRAGQEVSFVEEQLSIIKSDQRYVIDHVTPGATMQLGHGPTIVGVEVRQDPQRQRVLVRFDADLKADTVSKDTVKILDGAGNPVKADLTFDPDAHAVTLTVALRPGTYQLVVTTGIRDIAGASVAQEYHAPVLFGSGDQQGQH